MKSKKSKKSKKRDNESRKNNITLFKRMAYTVLILFIYDLLTYVSIPGVNAKQLSQLANNASLTMLSMFSGSGFSTFSIVSMGLSSYISAQIIVQLLQSNVVPKLTEWGKQGQSGREKLTQVTRTLTLILGFVQAIGIIAGINELSSYGFLLDASLWNFFVMSILLTAGSFISMFLADQITENGLGNGISVLIAAGIIKRLPGMASQFWGSISTSIRIRWDLLIITLLVVIFMMSFVVWINRSELRLRIQYSRRENPTTSDSYLPLKVIVPGVVPIIFASSLLTIPQTILLFFNQNGENPSTIHRVVQDFFSLNSKTGAILYAILIFVFTYLYSIVQVEPEKLAENLQRQEAYIPSIYPGDTTAVYIKQKLYELALPGALALSLISVIPLIVSNEISPSLEMGLSGSSMLIIIGVLADISWQIEGLKLKHEYSSFMRLNN